jgi:release factor glutamine methyltransferase
MTTIAAALAAARSKLPSAETRLLLGHVVERDAVWLITHDDHLLGEDQVLAFASLVKRRVEGEPIAYLIGYREFFGRDFRVGPGVLIPRPETELLVEIALAKVGAGGTAVNKTVLDLGTGSGCIAISIALESANCTVTAVDVSRAALSIAQNNARVLNASVRLQESHWYTTLGDARFDLIVSNPPYIAANDEHLTRGDLRHEPLGALASGHRGLDDIEHIIHAAPDHLNPGGSLWLEHGYNQADAVHTLLLQAGFHTIEQHRDLAGIIRVSGGFISAHTT